MQRRWIWWLVGSGVLVVALGTALEWLPRRWVQRILEKQTGTKVTVGQVRVSWWGPRVRMQDVTLYNTPDFGSMPALHIRALYADLSWSDLLRGHSRVRRLHVDVASVAVVQGQDGRFNWQVIGEQSRRRQEMLGTSQLVQVSTSSRTQPSASAAVDARKEIENSRHPTGEEGVALEGPPAATKVDELVVRLDRIEVYRMSSGSTSPTPRRLDVHLVHASTNVTDIDQFAWEFSAALALRAMPLLAVEAASSAGDEWSKSLEKLLQKADRWMKEAVGDVGLSNALKNLPAVLPSLF